MTSGAPQRWPVKRLLLVLGLAATAYALALLFWGNIETWLEPVVGFSTAPSPLSTEAVIAISLTFVIIGSIIGWISYARREVPIAAPRGSLLTRAARADLYGDAVNEGLIVRPSFWLSRLLIWFDGRVVDGLVNGSAALVGGASGRMRRYQSGFARSYALSMVGGTDHVLLALVLMRLS